MTLLVTLLLVAALICFIVAAVGHNFGRVGALGLGLALWVASVLLPRLAGGA